MNVQTLETEPQNMLVVHVHGRLAREDYRDFLPEFERLVRKNGRIRLLFVMERFAAGIRPSTPGKSSSIRGTARRSSPSR